MNCLIYILVFVTIGATRPERSNGVVPPDTLWHIRMMSPPVEGENTISISSFC